MNRFPLFLAIPLGVFAFEVSSHAEVKPALNPDAGILAKLEALGENSCCLLGDPKVIEDLGDFAKGWHRMKETGPTGRDFTIKMGWMPDRKRAFFCGANHGSPHHQAQKPCGTAIPSTAEESSPLRESSW